MMNEMEEKTKVLKELRQIPGVGRSIAGDLWNIGIRGIDDLKGRDPEELYQLSNRYQGVTIDRCLLYVYRCAVYYAETLPEKRGTDKLLWWNWKEK